MSAKPTLRASGLFCENDPQPRPRYAGTICFRLRDAPYGASIYATDEGEFQIREGPLALGKFHNNERLYEFARARSFGKTPGTTNAFRFKDPLIGEVMEILSG